MVFVSVPRCGSESMDSKTAVVKRQEADKKMARLCLPAKGQYIFRYSKACDNAAKY
jgi:hypothetical protein